MMYRILCSAVCHSWDLSAVTDNSDDSDYVAEEQDSEEVCPTPEVLARVPCM